MTDEQTRDVIGTLQQVPILICSNEIEKAVTEAIVCLRQAGPLRESLAEMKRRVEELEEALRACVGALHTMRTGRNASHGIRLLPLPARSWETIMSDKLARLLRLRKQVAALEEDLFFPHCGVCQRLIGLSELPDAWTCPCHTTVCADCWPQHEREARKELSP